MPIPHLAPTASGDDIAAVLASDGVVVVDRLADPTLMDRVRAELAPFMAATRTGPDEFSGHRTRRTGGLIARSPSARELVTHPTVLAAVRQSARTRDQLPAPSHPSDRDRPGRADADDSSRPVGLRLLSVSEGLRGPVQHDLGNDGFHCRQRGDAHHSGQPSASRIVCRLIESDTEPAEMEKGSVLFYTGSLYHGGGANRSDAVRCGVNITYNVAWLRQEENQYLAVPHDIARTLPVDLLRVMGYARGAYALGYVDDLRDPIEVLRPDLAKSGLGDLDAALDQIQQVSPTGPETKR